MFNFIRNLVYFCILLAIGLFAYGIYKSTLYLEKKMVPSVAAESDAKEVSSSLPQRSYSQYEEVITSHTPSFVKRPPKRKTGHIVSAFPVFYNLTSRDGRSIRVTLLGRPDHKTIQFQKKENNLVYTLPLSELKEADRKYIETLPVTSAW